MCTGWSSLTAICRLLGGGRSFVVATSLAKLREIRTEREVLEEVWVEWSWRDPPNLFYPRVCCRLEGRSMTIRPGHATKKSQGAATKSSTKGRLITVCR